MKICKRCNNEYPLSEFNTNRHISRYTGELVIYYHTYCKKCGKLLCKERRQTIRGMFTDIYNGQLNSSKLRKHTLPNYSQQELQIWMMNQSTYQILVDNWIKSNFARWYKPSCDRLDNSKPYSLDNLRLVTAGENSDTYKSDLKAGLELPTSLRKVNQYDLNQVFVTTYNSINAAARATGASPANIVNCCKGVYKTSKGFIWRYVDEY
jgi:hypothetical protein